MTFVGGLVLGVLIGTVFGAAVLLFFAGARAPDLREDQ